MEEKYPPTKIVQDLLDRGIIEFYEKYQQTIKFVEMIYIINPDHIIISNAPEFGRPTHIQYISEVFNQKKECICYNVFLFETCEVKKDVTLTPETMDIYKALV
jgi:hypothetical protein